MWIDTPQTLQKIVKSKETGTNSFIVQVYAYDRYPSMQEGLFYLKRWSSLEDVLIKWLCLDHDIVIIFSAKDNLKFPNVEMERKFKDLMTGGTEINFIADDKYSRMSMEGIKLFELPKDVVESAYAISTALAQQKLKIAVVILRAEILLPRTGIDYRLLDNIKCWVTLPENHTVIFLTDNKENIHHEIRHIEPPLMGHLEWPAPTREDFEKLFRNYKIIKPSIFNGNDLTQLAAACEGLQYLELEKLFNKVQNTKEILTEAIIQGLAANAQRLSLQHRAKDWLIEKPNVAFDMVAGIEDVKKIIQIKLIYPFKYPNRLTKRRIKIGNGVIFFGPPGTGKTLIVKAMATELNVPIFNIKGANVKSQWFGRSENIVRELFEAARKYKPCGIICIDEIDCLLPVRGTEQHMDGIVGQFLAEMDGVDTSLKTPVIVIGTTNKPLNLDDALMRPGRFDHKILVTLPDKQAREQLFRLNLYGAFALEINYSQLAELTEGYSGADIAGICRRTEEVLGLKDIEEGFDHPIDMNILNKVIKSTAPSVSKVEEERFRELGRRWNNVDFLGD